MMRWSLAFAIVVLTAGSMGIFFSRNLVEFFLCVELISVVSFFILSAIVIPAVFPPRVEAETVFIGGVAKSPYIHPEEIFSPGIPFLAGEIDEDWTLYYDKRKYKPVRKVN